MCIRDRYLSGKKKVEVPETRRAGNGSVLRIVGAKENNLQNLTVDIPLGTLTCVTGISGSGKSSLVNEVLYKYLSSELNGARPVSYTHLIPKRDSLCFYISFAILFLPVDHYSSHGLWNR